MFDSIRRIAVLLLLLAIFAGSLMFVVVTIVSSKATPYDAGLRAETATESLRTEGMLADGADLVEVSRLIFNETYDPSTQELLASGCLAFMTLAGVALVLYVWPTRRRVRAWLSG